MSIYGSFICNSPKLEMIQTSCSRCMAKTVVHPHFGILCSNEKEKVNCSFTHQLAECKKPVPKGVAVWLH
jgi:hypothetical protein